MNAVYFERGESIDYLNETNETIKEGSVVSLGTTRIGIAGTEIAPGKVGSLHVTGVFVLPKSSVAISIGDTLKFNTENDVVGADGDIVAGWAIENASADAATVKVKVG